MMKRVPGLETAYSDDLSIDVRDSIDVLVKNALFGAILVVVMLYLLMGPRNTIFILIGLPFTYFLTIIIMLASLCLKTNFI